MDYRKANEQLTPASHSLLINAPFSNEVIRSKVYRYFPGVLPPIQRVRQVPVTDLSLDVGHWPRSITNPRLNEPVLSRKPWLKNSGKSASLSIRDSPKPSRLSNWEAKELLAKFNISLDTKPRCPRRLGRLPRRRPKSILK